MICGEYHYTKDFPHCEQVNTFLKGTSQSIVLTSPLQPQQQKMVAQNPAPPKGGMQVIPLKGMLYPVFMFLCVLRLLILLHV